MDIIGSASFLDEIREHSAEMCKSFDRWHFGLSVGMHLRQQQQIRQNLVDEAAMVEGIAASRQQFEAERAALISGGGLNEQALLEEQALRDEAHKSACAAARHRGSWVLFLTARQEFQVHAEMVTEAIIVYRNVCSHLDEQFLGHLYQGQMPFLVIGNTSKGISSK